MSDSEEEKLLYALLMQCGATPDNSTSSAGPASCPTHDNALVKLDQRKLGLSIDPT